MAATRIVALGLLCACYSWAQVITTVAGTDWIFPAYSQPAIGAPLGAVLSVATDTRGNLYVDDFDNNIIVRVSSSGILTVVAGNGSPSYSGDGGPATSAALHRPYGVAVDTAGSLYIADTLNQRIRKVTPAGIISTVAGNGTAGFSGDNGPALSAQFNRPEGVTVDAAGNLYIADTANNRIRKVSPAGIISTVAGNGSQGYSGDTQLALNASLDSPRNTAVDTAGNLYIADTGNNRIRKVTTDGRIATIAGNGDAGFSGDGGPATAAEIWEPEDVIVGNTGNLYIAHSNNNRIRIVTTDGKINTVAGTNGAGFSGDGGPATSAMLYFPEGLALDPAGNLYIADTNNNRVRKVTPGGTISTVAGNGTFSYSGDGGPATSAALDNPLGIVLDAAQNLFIADTENNRIRKVTPKGVISTIAGIGIANFSGDGGPATSAALFFPEGLALDNAGSLYIAEQRNNRIRKITPNGVIATVAGNGQSGFSGDGGSATSAALWGPGGVALDANGNLYIADTTNNRIRKVTPNGNISTAAGGAVGGFGGDGGSGPSMLSGPVGVAVDAGGNLYIADTGNHRIRKLTPNGAISTVAGNGAKDFTGDGGPATAAALNSPGGIAVDSTGNLYIADTGNNRIRTVTSAGIISTVAGSGLAGLSGDGGAATRARLLAPNGVVVGAAGTLYIADSGNSRIREVVPSSAVSLQSSPASLSLSGTAGGSILPAQSVGLSSSITGVPYTAASNSSWLAVSPPGGSMPTSLQVRVNPGSLAAGTYQGMITISAPLATPSNVTIAVSATILPAVPAQLSVQLQRLSLTAEQGGAAATVQLQVANAGGGMLSYTAAASTVSGGTWLSVSPVRGSATPSTPASLTVTANPGSLTPGTYTATIAVTGAGTTARVPVTLSVSPPGAVILVSESGLSFNAVAQGGAPLPKSFGILNQGQGSMDWSATSTTLSGGSNWLQISPSSGTLVQPFLDVSLVKVSIDPTGLTPGDYYGQIHITASAANTPQLLTVILTVLPAGVSPGPEIQPSGLIFTGVAGSTPGSQDVLLGNLKPQPDSFLSTQIGTGFTYLPAGANVRPNQPTTVRVFPDFSTLQPGDIQRGTIFLQFADGTPRAITVLIVVAPSATLPAVRIGPEASSSCSSKNLEVEWRSLSPQPGFSAILGQPTSLEVQVVDDCGNLIGPTNPQNASVTATFSNKDADLKLTHIGNGVWTGTWRPVNSAPGQATVSVTAFNSTGSVLQSGQRDLSGTISAAGSTPTVTSGGVVHAASDAVGVPIAPGSLITLYGSNLADAVGQATTLPLPQQQNGAQVLLGDLPLPILYTSSGQVNVQVPFNTPVNGQYQITVQRDNLLSVPEQLVIAAAQPGVFTLNEQGTGQGVIFRSDGVTLAQPGTAATVGETVVIYCTGLGAVNPPVPEGTPPPSSPLSNTMSRVTVSIGGQNAPVSFSGLTPGFPGLYQVNAVVPAGVSGDAMRVVVSVAGQNSPPVTMAVQ